VFLGIKRYLSDAGIFILHKKPKRKRLTDEQGKGNIVRARCRWALSI